MSIPAYLVRPTPLPCLNRSTFDRSENQRIYLYWFWNHLFVQAHKLRIYGTAILWRGLVLFLNSVWGLSFLIKSPDETNCSYTNSLPNLQEIRQVSGRWWRSGVSSGKCNKDWGTIGSHHKLYPFLFFFKDLHTGLPAIPVLGFLAPFNSLFGTCDFRITKFRDDIFF